MPPSSSERPRPRPARVAALVLVAAVAGAYANALGGPFLPDDVIAIRHTPEVRHLRTSLESFDDERHTSVSGRPLAALTLAANYAAGGANVVGYRLVNVLLHAMAALLLWAVVAGTHRRLAGSGARALGLPLAVALLWAVHPLATDAVDYVVQRTEILAALFILLAIRLSMRGAEPGASRLWSVAAVAACACGALSKETAAAGPILVLVHDACFLSRSWGAALRRRPWLYAGLAASWAPIAIAAAAGARGDAVGFDLGVSGWDYLLTQADVLACYLGLAAWPSPLVVSYHDWPIAHSIDAVWPEALLVSSLFAATAALLARRHWIGFAGAAFFLVLAPSSSVVPIVTEIAAEHRMYLPLAAVIAVAVAAGTRALRALAARGVTVAAERGRPVLVAALAVSLGVATHVRNRDYRSAVAIWEDAAEKRPANPVAHGALAFALEEGGELERAVAEYRQALLLDPEYWEGWEDLGHALARLGRQGDAAQAFFKAERAAANAAHRSAGVRRR